MLLNIVVIVVVLLGALLAFAATRPGTFRVQRATSMRAQPATIAALITDFRQWAAWSPYEQLDPAMRKTYGGTASGVGASYEWQGKKAGAGRMEILAATLTKIVIKLDFSRPMPAHNTAEFLLDARDGTTDVTWAMYGRSSLPAKAMSLFISMDQLVGKDFERGLANLKALAER
jgi:hypothetical protein